MVTFLTFNFRMQHQLRQFFIAITATGVILSISQIIIYSSSKELFVSKVLTENKISTKRNVYHLILDNYGRKDILNDIYHFNNQPFHNFLETNHFTTIPEARAPYPITYYSLGVTLMADWFFDNKHFKFNHREPFYRVLKGENSVVKTYKKNDYKYVHYSSMFYSGSRCSGFEDECIRMRPGNYLEAEENLVQMTPLFFLYRVIERFSFSHQPFVSKIEIDRITKWVNEDSRKLSAPFFLFAHLLSPHAPFQFDNNCKEIKDIKVSLKAFSPKAYINEIKCLNKKIKKFIQTINENDPEAIVIIHGDHGPHPERLDGLSHEKYGIHLKSNLSPLMAIKLPTNCRQLTYDKLSAVNIHRVVLSCLTNSTINLVPDDSYFVIIDKDEFIKIPPEGE